jgi:hypothetical protein
MAHREETKGMDQPELLAPAAEGEAGFGLEDALDGALAGAHPGQEVA